MGNVEDVRKVIQDFVAPDLKALAVRLEALEKEMKVRFDHVDARLEEAGKVNQERLSSMDKLMSVRHEALIATMAANHASIMSTWEMEKLDAPGG